MPQQTNLNVSPYFDDFDKDKDYYKVLFKPSYPIQARELTGLQSILQNQIESFGTNIFNEGSVVVPGNITYKNPVDCVQIRNSFNGVPISNYYNQLIGRKIIGKTSGVTAEIVFTLTDLESTSNNYSLFLSYIESGGDNFENKEFFDGEDLLVETDLVVGEFGAVIAAGQAFATTISENSKSKGTLFTIDEGIYFVRGIFARVMSQTIALTQFSTTPSFKVGLNVSEEIVSCDEDSSLVDNAKGFLNYAAPGADRFKLKLTLDKRSFDQEVTSDFVRLFECNSGVPSYFISNNSQYNIIRDELAKRTFDESGNYVVSPFSINIKEHLNDKYQTLGLYKEGEVSVDGNTASEDLITYKINPGKAYVNGYDVETIAPKFLDVEKPRTTEKVDNISIPFNAGTFFIVDNVFGSATIGLGTNQYIDLMDSRLGPDKTVAAGTTIGKARVYDYVPESAYADDKSRMFLRLFDIDTYTKITLSTQTSITTPAQIKGKTSNAIGYLKESVSGSTNLTLYSVQGQFLNNERIIVNGVDDGRLIKSITDYSIRDIKSVYADSSVGISTFNADIKLESKSAIAPPGTLFDVTGLSGGISTVTSGLNSDFLKKLKEGDIISYASADGTNTPIYNKVNSVSAGGTSFTISEVTSVDGICNGSISTLPFSVTNIVRINATVDDNAPGLITVLDRPNVSNVELNTSTIYQRRSFQVTLTSDSFSIDLTTKSFSDDLYFVDFDEDDYVITYDDGTIEPIRFDKFNKDTTGKQITFAGLSKSSGTAEVITTVYNERPNPKLKQFNAASTLLVDKSLLSSSGIGTTTLNDGLTYNQIYGLRVQDEEISLNVPDVVRVLAIYQSSTTSDPNLPRFDLSSFTGPSNNTSDYKIGEVFEGLTSGSIGLIVSKASSTQIEFVYLNNTSFSNGEVIVSKETNIEAQITKIYVSDKNILNDYEFDNGQTPEIYDYSRIRRKAGTRAPNKKLKIVFQNYTIPENDPGEFICINSYPKNNYKYDIPLLNSSLSNRDLIDLRPRVKSFNISLNRSPFEKESKDLSFSGALSNYNLVPGKNLRLSYNYYLGRIDKVVLNPDGRFEVLKGIPSINPVARRDKANALTIGEIELLPYTFDVTDIAATLKISKRYQMQDISLLEDRISRLEKYTTLTLTEMKTESLIIKDSETGLDRFKSGFFVDNFNTQDFVDNFDPSIRCDVSMGYCKPFSVVRNLDLQLGSEAISGVTNTFNANADQSSVTDLGSQGITKTGDLITLSYNEVEHDSQSDATETINIGQSSYWRGNVTLTPSSDVWFDENTVEDTSTQEQVSITSTNENSIKETVVKEKVVWIDPCWVGKKRWWKQNRCYVAWYKWYCRGWHQEYGSCKRTFRNNTVFNNQRFWRNKYTKDGQWLHSYLDYYNLHQMH